MHCLQQRLDAEEAQREIAFALLLIPAEIKPRAEMIARAVEHQQPRAVGAGVFDGVDQRVDQPRRQRIGLGRAVQRQAGEVAVVFADEVVAHGFVRR